MRFIARRDGDRGTDRVPLIVEAMLALPVPSATIDGEGVVVDDRGVTDFERLTRPRLSVLSTSGRSTITKSLAAATKS